MYLEPKSFKTIPAIAVGSLRCLLLGSGHMVEPKLLVFCGGHLKPRSCTCSHWQPAQRVQVPIILGFCSQKPSPSWFLRSETLNIGYWDPRGLGMQSSRISQIVCVGSQLSEPKIRGSTFGILPKVWLKGCGTASVGVVRSTRFPKSGCTCGWEFPGTCGWEFPGRPERLVGLGGHPRTTSRTLVKGVERHC